MLILGFIKNIYYLCINKSRPLPVRLAYPAGHFYLWESDIHIKPLLFTAIQTIEVSVRTKIIKHLALEFGAFWFMDENYAINKTRFAANLSVIRKEVSRSHDDFITEHFRKYSEPDLPPVWKTLEVISMGTLSKLYANFSDSAAKHAVAREFGLKVYWLNSIFTDNTFVTDFKQLLARHQSVNPHLLGFPYNWEQEPLWK